MRKTDTFFRDLLRDTAGNILPMAAAGSLVAAGIVGSAVDLSRAYKVKSQLQSACDAGVLAGRRTVTTNGFDTASSTAATKYFNTNFNNAAQETRSTSFTPTSPDNGTTVTATASTTLDTLVMRLFGFQTFTLSVNCSSSMGVGNSDIMMVLDTTGSMDFALSSSQTRIQALRAAMKNFYTTVANATAGTNARVRYGFVPFSSTVNVGRLLYNLNPNYIADRYTYPSREAVYDATTSTAYGSPSTTYGGPDYDNYGTSSWIDYEFDYSSMSNCTKDMPSTTTTFSNYGSASSSNSTTTSGGQEVVTTTTVQPQRRLAYTQCVSYTRWGGGTRYKVQIKYETRDKTTYTYVTRTMTTTTTYTFDHYDYKPVQYDTSRFKTFASTTTTTGDGGATETTTWGGCIRERATVNTTGSFSFSALTGISPSGATDIDIDTAPNISDDSTKWAPLWPQIVYTRYNATTDYWGRTNYSATTGTGNYGESVTTYCPAAAQGLQTMTQTAFNTYADSLYALGGTYLDIGMIWGGRLSSPDGIFSSTVNSAPSNGGEVSRHVLFMTDGEMAPNSDIDTAWGLEWWERKVTSDGTTNNAARHTARFLAVCEAIKAKGIRVWTIAFTTGSATDLETCASDNSYFSADNATELNNAFQEIAKQVGELRITQ